MRTQLDRGQSVRPGAVLMVVLAMLALFSVVAVGFVIFSEQEVVSANLYKESQQVYRPNPDVLFSQLLNQLIYDTGDAESALHRQGLLLNMYSHGRDDAGNPLPDNSVPFNGSGKLHVKDRNGQVASIDDLYYYINYSAYRQAFNLNLNDPAVLNNLGAFNPPYTYPDHNAPYLGMIRADGTVTARSFVRVGPGTPGIPGNFNPYDPAHADFWTNPDYPPGVSMDRKRAMTLRPIPCDGRRCYVLRDPTGAFAGTFFPAPEDRTGDVKNLPPGTRVLYYNSLTGQVEFSYGNDSYWFDPNLPVMVGPDGKRYKALFAMFVMDLDGKLNVNSHLNIKGDGGRHVSNHGLGPWEVGPPTGTVSDEFVAFSREFPLLFVGRAAGRTAGKYFAHMNDGNPPVPGAGGAPGTIIAGPGHALVDSNGYDESGGGRTAPLVLPGRSPQAVSWSGFPHFPAGYDNSVPTAPPPDKVLLNHPLLYSELFPVNDQAFPPSQLELLYRMGDTGTDTLTSDLVRLCPDSFRTNGLKNRLRWQVTTISRDHAVYGRTPWARPGVAFLQLNYDPQAAVDQANSPHGRLPSVIPLPGDDGTPAIQPPPLDGEFNPNWTAKRPRINAAAFLAAQRLNALYQFNGAALPDYPPIDAASGRYTDMAAYTTALRRRQDLAAHIYFLLVQSTAAYDPTKYAQGGTYPAPGAAEVRALRWLAQVAVNVVDLMDNDHCMTPFRWTDDARGIASADFLDEPTVKAELAASGEWVFGTEMPRLVLNETYAEYYNYDDMDLKKFRVSIWAELLNPLKTRQCYDGGLARLELPGMAGGPKVPVYKLVIAKGTDKTPPDEFLRRPGNVFGLPESAIGEVADFNPNNDPKLVAIGPVEERFGAENPMPDPADPKFYALYPDAPQQGWFLLGPGQELPKNAAAMDADPLIPRCTAHSALMQYEDEDAGQRPKYAPMLLLRRLACPHLPENNDPSRPEYNPYITVDYVASVRINKREVNGAVEMNVDSRAAVGRSQPYAAHLSQWAVQAPTTATNQPQHTFLRHNYQEATPPANNPQTGMLKLPFDWLVHFDRPLTSPMELLHVSAFKPHELTQQFMYNQDRFQHLLPWFAINQPYYRFLELLELSFPANQGNGNRRAGRINLCTMDRETFLGLCDMPDQRAEIERIWGQIELSRGDWVPGPGGAPRPNVLNGALLPQPPGEPYRGPFWSLDVGPQVRIDAGNYGLPSRNGTRGIVDTWLRPNDAAAARPLWGSDRRRLLEIADPNADHDHPWERARLLTKIANNVTTRSNVFAVWVTVGFFEVVPELEDPTRPPGPDNKVVDKLGVEIGRAENRHVRHRMFAIVDRTAFTGSYHLPIGTATTMPADRLRNPYTGIDPRRGDSNRGQPPTVLYWTIIE